MNFPLPNYTQIPNYILDEAILYMKPSTLKIVLVILRKTFGWHKQCDKISLSQFEELTGLNRPSVLIGIDEALSMLLITRTPIPGCKEFIYGLNADWFDGGSKFEPGGSSKFEPGSSKFEHTKETIYTQSFSPNPDISINSSSSSSSSPPPNKEEEEEIFKRLRDRPKNSPEIVSFKRWSSEVLADIRNKNEIKKKESDLKEKLDKSWEAEQEEKRKQRIKEEEEDSLKRKAKIEKNIAIVKNLSSSSSFGVTDKGVKLFGGNWYGFLLNYEDPDFENILKNHLASENNGNT